MSCEMLKKSHYDYSTLLKRGAASDLKICTGKNSCCTKSIENEIVKSSEKIFKAQLEDKIIVLRHMINSDLNSFKTYFYNSLNTCHEHLDALFDRTYGTFYQSNSQAFDTFFNRLRAFSSPFSDTKVPQAVRKLLEDLFIIIFQLMNPMHNVNAEQRRCIIDSMDDIAPFGDVPKKIITNLEKSLVFWKQFVVGLVTVHNILEGFMNVSFHSAASVSNDCKENLARMWDCSLCSGMQESRPCSGLCMNVMKGCLSDWTEIDQQWNAVIDNFLKISSKLRGSQNLHYALQPLPVQFSEAVMEMQERGVTVSNKVIARCYAIGIAIPSTSRPSPQRYRRAVFLRGITERAANYGKVLDSLMQMFSKRISSLRGWFTSLPKAFCYDSGLVAKDGEKCWNGNETASYERKIAKDELQYQRENPEYKTQRFIPYRGLFVDERLRLGMLSFRLQSTLYGKNYTNYQIEGSGNSDDEDYSEGSGSLSIISLVSSESSEDSVDVLPHTSSTSRQLVRTSLIICIFIKSFNRLLST
ncbi:glypican [Dictyocaulus viviparus]|uniref:Glypican n=1 Tax=Dictyocaulus viviparus TaxID=29172 RepID=A0A0D8XRL9_DICVI|nr:glypican [Dictyocaulus viviparus]